MPRLQMPVAAFCTARVWPKSQPANAMSAGKVVVTTAHCGGGLNPLSKIKGTPLARAATCRDEAPAPSLWSFH